MPHPLIIGEAPNKTGDPSVPISGALGTKLAAFCGLDPQAFLATFRRTNVLKAWPGPGAAKGAAYDVLAARRRIGPLARQISSARIVILLGKRVAATFDLAPTYFAEQQLYGTRAYVVPHPSGVNRWYNSAENRAAMAGFMRALLEGLSYDKFGRRRNRDGRPVRRRGGAAAATG